MKKILLIALIFVLIPTLVLAQAINSTTTTTKPVTKIPGSETLKVIYDFLVQANPILLLILGGVLVVVSKFAKWVGIILIIIALIHLILLLIK